VAVADHHSDPRDCVGSVHLVGALLVGSLDASATSESLATGASTRMVARQPPRARERSGLGVNYHAGEADAKQDQAESADPYRNDSAGFDQRGILLLPSIVWRTSTNDQCKDPNAQH